MTEAESSSLFSPAAELDNMLNVPEVVFIVPYRNREQHKHFYTRYMKDYILKNIGYKWQILFIHQCDMRAFNRGAMKNLGFKYLKDKYPKYYKNITIVFNDVDTAPYKPDLVDFRTTHGVVKHFYGFDFAFGGIVSMKAGDFETLNGFPNLWAWGFEDNELQLRWIETFGKSKIDRSTFFKNGDSRILVIFHGIHKLVSPKQKEEYGDIGIRNRKPNARLSNGLNTIYDVNYEKEELEPNVIIVNVNKFETQNKAENYTYEKIDLSQVKYVISGKRRGGQMGMLNLRR
jgi:hypothetical protein